MAYRRTYSRGRRSYSRRGSRVFGAYSGSSRRSSAGRGGRRASAGRAPATVKLVIEHTAPTAVQRPDLAGVMVEKPTKRAKL